jgi:hypothetical protein
MLRSLLVAAAIMLPATAGAAEHVSGTNYYVVRQERFSAGSEVYWTEDNSGSFTVNEGPIDPGYARCVGSGFDLSGGGICVYGEGEDTFTMKWKIETFGVNSWRIVAATGKYAGMRGEGTTRTRVDSRYLKPPTGFRTGKVKSNCPAETSATGRQTAAALL